MSFFRNGVLAGAAVLACAWMSSAMAADASVGNAKVRPDFSAMQAKRAALLAHTKPAAVQRVGASMPKADGVTAATTTTSSALEANNYRAYPQSCFADVLPNTAYSQPQPLPVASSGPIYQSSQPVELYEVDQNGNNTTETVTVTVWRVPCSSSGDNTLPYNPTGGPVSATLVRIQRASGVDGTTSSGYPRFPDVRVAQGSIAFDNSDGTDYVRVSAEPNTLFEDQVPGASAIVYSTTYVLENYSTYSLFDFNQAFQIRFDNGYVNSSGTPVGQYVISVPAYSPTQQNYPAAFQPLPIDGYMTGAWYDPNIGSREGLLTEVLDNGDGATRQFIATWYTYDYTGLPVWLIAGGGFNIGATQVSVPVNNFTGGTFAATTAQSVAPSPWGTLNVQFPDCQHIQINYAGPASSTNHFPAGSGTLNWQRIGNINNLNCQ
jgi:hypothetical protein